MGVKYLVLLCVVGEGEEAGLSFCLPVGRIQAKYPGPDLTTKFLQTHFQPSPEMSCRGLAMAVLTA